MDSNTYTKFSDIQLNKIGNTAVYLAERIGDLSKTKLLKLLYILDELAITTHGIPFLNLKYKVWKFGPVSEEIFIDLSSEINFLDGYIFKNDIKGTLETNAEFNDDEFSDNDIKLLDLVIEKFGSKTAKQLVDYTHRPNSPWYETAKSNDVLDLLLDEEINNTEIVIDMSQLVSHDTRKKQMYLDYVELF